MVKFNRLRRGTHLPDLIVSEIMTQIAEGGLQPGDSLPTETALADEFGVSRNVVREAIARLRSDGVINTKQGRGAVVLPPSERASFRIDTTRLQEETNLSHLFELRGLLEIDAAGIAADRRTEAHLQQMQSAIDEMAGKKEFDEARLEADAQFHRALGAATHNEYLGAIMDYLSGRLKETTRATHEVYAENDLIEVTISEHRRILDAVKAGDAEAARAAMKQHIRGAAERLGVAMPSQSDFVKEDKRHD